MVIKNLMKRRVSKASSAAMERLLPDDIERAKKILFSVFSRYGDAIISLKIVREFIEAHPGKEYLLVTSNQLAPYAERMLGDAARLFSLDKRKNPVKVLSTVNAIKEAGVDLGLNPFSFGEDSEYFISFASRFFSFKDFSKHSEDFNLYQMVRDYLLLDAPSSDGRRSAPDLLEPGGVERIIVAPSSSNRLKSLLGDDLERLLSLLSKRFSAARITVALSKQDASGVPDGYETFIFEKSRKSSELFLEMIERADLFVAVDAGPLHLADALGKRVIGIFGPTAPETILDLDSAAVALRAEKLAGIFCNVKRCEEPLCIDALFRGDISGDTVEVDFARVLILETETCKVK